MLFERSQRPLRSLSVFLDLGILHKLLGVLVDAEVGEMYEPLADILGLGVVLVGSKSSQPLSEHVYPQGVVTSHQHVYPQVVFEVIDQMGVVYVLGN